MSKNDSAVQLLKQKVDKITIEIEKERQKLLWHRDEVKKSESSIEFAKATRKSLETSIGVLLIMDH